MADNDEGFSAAERQAIKDRAAELASTKGVRGAAKVAKEAEAVLKVIEEMSPDDRALAERIHHIVLEAAPQLSPKTFYSQPGYALDGKVICFFQAAGKYKTRYGNFAFNETGALGAGGMWATAFAIESLSDADEKTIAELVKKAVAIRESE